MIVTLYVGYRSGLELGSQYYFSFNSGWNGVDYLRIYCAGSVVVEKGK